MAKITAAHLAIQAFALLQENTPAADVKATLAIDESTMWSKVSALVYEKAKVEARQERDKDARRPHVSATSNAEITDLLALNEQLAGYALLAPPTITVAEFKKIGQLAAGLPASESAILAYLDSIITSPKMCAILKQGFEYSPAFQSFTSLVDAAISAYYQENYVSAFLTLVPVVEGLILRWNGFDGTGPEPKPEFEAIRKFVGNSYLRQPNPGNVLFHDVYVKASQAILNKHLYLNSETGSAYANFSRHLAAHLLSNEAFATQPNCVRLFILLDALLKVHNYETKPAKDPRFHVDEPLLQRDVLRYQLLIAQQRMFRKALEQFFPAAPNDASQEPIDVKPG
ncbi:hypothetical protein [Hymenobacter convexus]|uniref:hypothetical protein n=1 Tax=Hymenobacter sp. CA1UV-4 TaxID=3063782 RepID=UPI002713DC01|nr:hypothetical protein [Hymenobacter sp. CA1UV-4]MDO7854634.1 hypothetical protein [Hymenobacter sp. CA1UV-4]